MFGIVYKLTNLVNGKVYVGQTVRPLLERFRKHVSLALQRDSQFAVHLAIRKYGCDQFVVAMLDSADNRDELHSKEERWVVLLDSMNPVRGYNMTFRYVWPKP